MSITGLRGTADEDWALDALCAQTDPDLFFPEKGGEIRKAKRVCNACPVTAECLAYALANDERYGVWGGTGAVERRRLTTDLEAGAA